MQKVLKINELQDINEAIDLAELKEVILKQHGSFANYARTFNIHEGDLSSFLNKKRPITIRQILKHAKNVRMNIKLQLTQEEI